MMAPLRGRLDKVNRRIRNLYAALVEGTVGDTAPFREVLHGLESQREETVRLLSLLDVEAPSLRRALSKAQAQAVAAKLKSRLIEAPPAMQRRYVRGLVSQIVADQEKAVMSGPKAAIATAIAAQALDGEVRSFVRNGAGAVRRKSALPLGLI